MKNRITKDIYFEWDYFDDRPYPRSAATHLTRIDDSDYKNSQGQKISDIARQCFGSKINVVGSCYYKPHSNHKKRDDELYLIVERDSVLLGLFVGNISIVKQSDHKCEVHHDQAVSLIENSVDMLIPRIEELFSMVKKEIDNQQALDAEVLFRSPSPTLENKAMRPKADFLTCMYNVLGNLEELQGSDQKALLVALLNMEDETTSRLKYHFVFKENAIIYAHNNIKNLTRHECVDAIISLNGVSTKVYCHLLAEGIRIQDSEIISLLASKLLDTNVRFTFEECNAQISAIISTTQFNRSFISCLLQLWLNATKEMTPDYQILMLDLILKLPSSTYSSNNQEDIDKLVLDIIKGSHSKRLSCEMDSSHEVYYRNLHNRYFPDHLTSPITEYFNANTGYALLPKVPAHPLIKDATNTSKTVHHNNKQKKKKKKKKKTISDDIQKINILLGKINMESPSQDSLDSLCQKSQDISDIFKILEKNKFRNIPEEVAHLLWFFVALYNASIVTKLYEQNRVSEIALSIRALILSLQGAIRHNGQNVTPITRSAIFMLSVYKRNAGVSCSLEEYKDHVGDLVQYSENGSYFYGMLNFFHNDHKPACLQDMFRTFHFKNDEWKHDESGEVYDETISTACQLRIPDDITNHRQWALLGDTLIQLLAKQKTKLFAPSYMQNMDVDIREANHFLASATYKECMANSDRRYMGLCIDAYQRLLDDSEVLSNDVLDSLIENMTSFIPMLTAKSCPNYDKLVNVCEQITLLPTGSFRRIDKRSVSLLYLLTLEHWIDSLPSTERTYIVGGKHDLYLRLRSIKGWTDGFSDYQLLKNSLYYIVLLSSEPGVAYETKCLRIQKEIQMFNDISQSDLNQLITQLGQNNEHFTVSRLMLNDNWKKLPGMDPFFSAILNQDVAKIKYYLGNGYTSKSIALDGGNAYDYAVWHLKLDSLLQLEIDHEHLFSKKHSQSSLAKILFHSEFLVALLNQCDKFRSLILDPRHIGWVLEFTVFLSKATNQKAVSLSVLGQSMIVLIERCSPLPNSRAVKCFTHYLLSNGITTVAKHYVQHNKHLLLSSPEKNVYPMHNLVASVPFQSVLTAHILLKQQCNLDPEDILNEMTTKNGEGQVLIDCLPDNVDPRMYKLLSTYFDIEPYRKSWQQIVYGLVDKNQQNQLSVLHQDIGIHHIMSDDIDQLLSDAIDAQHYSIMEYLIENDLFSEDGLAEKIQYCSLHGEMKCLSILVKGLPIDTGEDVFRDCTTLLSHTIFTTAEVDISKDILNQNKALWCDLLVFASKHNNGTDNLIWNALPEAYKIGCSNASEYIDRYGQTQSAESSEALSL